ncbi:hypothetical protein Ancab_038768 [Ancistrocladus abbreviatus]
MAYKASLNCVCKLCREKDPSGLQDEAENVLVDMDAAGAHAMWKLSILYQAARIGEGDEMIDTMKSASYGDALDLKAYYGFLKILCGIERIDHAMKDGCKPGIETYDLLTEKLRAHGRVDKGNALFNEALQSGIHVEPKFYKLDSRFVKKPTALQLRRRRND